CDPAGIRTQDPYIKSVLLYQLSYGIIPFFGTAKVVNDIVYAKPFLKIFAISVMHLGCVST
ncbi:MAG: hypothetical protein RIT07_721, partial [Bacteroidota bacterium]